LVANVRGTVPLCVLACPFDTAARPRRRWNTFYKPPALSVTQTPVIGLLISSVGQDPVRIVAGGALIWVAEIDPAFVTQNPDTSLGP
jgi:hypothetical protein